MVEYTITTNSLLYNGDREDRLIALGTGVVSFAVSMSPAGPLGGVAVDIAGGIAYHGSDNDFTATDFVELSGEVPGGILGGIAGASYAGSVAAGFGAGSLATCAAGAGGLVIGGGIGSFVVGGVTGAFFTALNEGRHGPQPTIVQSRNSDASITTQTHQVIGQHSVDGEEMAIVHTTTNIGGGSVSNDIPLDQLEQTFQLFRDTQQRFLESERTESSDSPYGPDSPYGGDGGRSSGDGGNSGSDWGGSEGAGSSNGPSNPANPNGGYDHSGSGTTTGGFPTPSGEWEGGNGYQDHGTPDPSLPANPDFSGAQPVVLDLDGDGIEIAYGQQTFFDMDGDGYLERTSWAAADDGFLVIDLNADGTIGDGDGEISQPRLRTHNQNNTVAARAIAERNNSGHRS